jgi:hypothetical protein
MARLLTVTSFESITDEIKTFVEFQAAQKKIEVTPLTRVAVLQVENIPSYHVIFLDSGITYNEILKELELQDLQINEDTKMKLTQILQK